MTTRHSHCDGARGVDGSYRALGVVLVGGRSRRMGADKALLDWGGRPMGSIVADRLQAVTTRVIAVGGGGRDYRRLGVPHLPDDPTLPGGGPMVGVVTALGLAERVLVVACDMPLLESSFLSSLLCLAGDAAATAPVAGGRLHPLVGVYRRAVLRAAHASLARGSGRMSDLFQVPGARRLSLAALGEPAALREQLENLNDRGDLRRTASVRGSE